MNSKTEKTLLQIVSRETICKYQTYFSELKKWNQSTRLVQEKTLDEFWSRHILDSLQLIPLLGTYTKIIDIGSGAGFPGMVLAISGIENITLCESMNRKCVFLNEIKRKTNTSVNVLHSRVENLKDHDYDLILSRATTNLTDLIKYALIVSRETIPKLLIHKGKNYKAEIIEAEKEYTFKWQSHTSVTCEESVVLHIYDILPIV